MSGLSWRLIPFVLFILLGAFFWRGLSLDPQKLPSMQLGQSLPAFKLPTLEGAPPFLSARDMKGHVAILNVWASWCATCAEEQLFLLTLAHEGVAIYGLNYKDAPADAKQWLSQWGNPYVLTGSDRNGHVAIDLGVYGAPETFLVDEEGIIRYRHVGALNATVWRDVFVPKIQALEHA